MKREWLGILVNDSLIEGIRKRNTGHENLRFYQEAGEKYQLTPCYFRLQDISLRAMRVTAFTESNGIWRTVRISLPSIIHNRAIFHTPKALERMKWLEDQGVQIYNFWNRYSKLYISRLLEEEPQLHPFLPKTMLFTRENCQTMCEEFPSFLAKPVKGSVGEGIILCENADEQSFIIKFRQNNRVIKRRVSNTNLYLGLKRITGNARYLLQEKIQLATFEGSPFDLRVSVQKNGTGEWGVTGIVCKVAHPGHFLSNVAQGGRVVNLEKAVSAYPHLHVEKVTKKVEQAALTVTHYLDQKLPHLADLGYDFGIDEQGQPYFIEMNSRDQRYSFAKGNMMDRWRLTYENPIAYGKYLLDKKEGSQ
ncbi:YheC/YheD family protein [Ammoniphilus resinae]|uniref:YheC/YheD family protein n=1 Tax=Ammoniphilus resinae TaxID=861532 RepID=A0ABS4GSY5_9BACL|nr:YheC/YheD family protein [Ammoniphilus resinae]MBP1933394.1 hypothetical protein [Ammoniphilus resinae]